MILLDTNIIIDYWRSTTKETGQALLRLDSCICGAVLAELLQGARNEWEVAWARRAVSKYRWLGTPSKVWHRLGMNLMTLRREGLAVPFPDALLATVAIEHNVPLWSRDKHFVKMQQVLPALQLYKPEAES